MQADGRPLGIRGFLIDAPSMGKLRAVRDGAVVIEDGCIAAVGAFESLRAESGDVRWLHSPESVVLPGLIDLHTHLPQYPAVGRAAADAGEWFDRHIDPLEHQFRAAAARREARAFFDDLARHGTTCAAVFAGASPDSAEETFRAAEASGMRVLLGAVLGDLGTGSRGASTKALDKQCADSEALCRKWHGRDNGRIEYAFSPRCVASCSEELTRRAVRLADQYEACLQTHLAEHREEPASARARFRSGDGALARRTLLGHCLHLDDAELADLSAGRAAVVHCPTSNLFLANGLLPLERVRAAGLRIGLGSDVATGPDLNMWQVMRAAIETQAARHCYDPTILRLGASDAFHLATQGGAEAIGKERFLGTLEVGKDADLVVFDLAAVTPYGRKLNPHAHLGPEDIISLFVHRGGPAAVVETFVRGRPVYRAPAPLLV